MILTIPDTDVRIDIATELLQDLVSWAVAGTPDPIPDIVKKLTVVQYAKSFGCASFIETGTFTGTTTRLMAELGLQCKTIELAEHHYRNAVQELSRYANVQLYLGDSGDQLGAMIDQAVGPHLIWLDGHYSGDTTARGIKDTPLLRELQHLRARDVGRSVILIDDIRDFGHGDYPPVAAVVAFAREHWPTHAVEVRGDILRITPGMTLAERLRANLHQHAA